MSRFPRKLEGVDVCGVEEVDLVEPFAGGRRHVRVSVRFDRPLAGAEEILTDLETSCKEEKSRTCRQICKLIK